MACMTLIAPMAMATTQLARVVRYEEASILENPRLERTPLRMSWVVATDGVVTVGLDVTLDDSLRLEARVNDLIRAVQVLRKDSGLEITDRIRLWIPEADLLPFADRIAEETLAVSVELGPELRLEKA